MPGTNTCFLLTFVLDGSKKFYSIRPWTLADDPCSLEEVVGDVTAGHLALAVEVDLDELAEPRAVVVPGRLGVAESLLVTMV